MSCQYLPKTRGWQSLANHHHSSFHLRDPLFPLFYSYSILLLSSSGFPISILQALLCPLFRGPLLYYFCTRGIRQLIFLVMGANVRKRDCVMMMMEFQVLYFPSVRGWNTWEPCENDQEVVQSGPAVWAPRIDSQRRHRTGRDDEEQDSLQPKKTMMMSMMRREFFTRGYSWQHSLRCDCFLIHNVTSCPLSHESIENPWNEILPGRGDTAWNKRMELKREWREGQDCEPEVLTWGYSVVLSEPLIFGRMSSCIEFNTLVIHRPVNSFHPLVSFRLLNWSKKGFLQDIERY